MFEVIDIQDWPRVAEEPMGGKTKEWREAPDGHRWLFKEVKRTSADGILVGEDWAEKIVSELARSCGFSAALVELATDGNRRGCLVRSVLDSGEELVHGNELLSRTVDSYPRDENFGTWYTVENSQSALNGLSRSLAWQREVTQQFSSYLLLDAWVANTDRHHENWAVVFRGPGVTRISPTYDHASSLGFNLSDESRRVHLETKDRNRTVEAFANRGKSPFYFGGVRLSLVDAASRSCHLSGIPEANLQALVSFDCASLIDEVPSTLMSDFAKEFSLRLLTENANRLQAVLS